jgi:hypothetical protein
MIRAPAEHRAAPSQSNKYGHDSCDEYSIASEVDTSKALLPGLVSLVVDLKKDEERDKGSYAIVSKQSLGIQDNSMNTPPPIGTFK